MKERPILFSGPMVRAILEGRKTQTRRVMPPLVNPSFTQYVMTFDGKAIVCEPRYLDDVHGVVSCPYGVVGDWLWVRETFTIQPQSSITSRDLILYRADAGNICFDGKWKPAIFMPRLASRILLEVTEVRVQRLQDISEDDARAEGAELAEHEGTWAKRGIPPPESHVRGFMNIWHSINGKSYPWASNPWVWAITFKRIAPEQNRASNR